MEKLINKMDNVINLYNQLNKNGARTKFFIAAGKQFDRSANTIKNHWFGMHEIPDDDDDVKKDWMIKYLQNAIFEDT